MNRPDTSDHFGGMPPDNGACLLYFVRHGRTTQNTEKRFQGHSDTDLDETGRWQADCLARRMTEYAINAVYTSDLARARQTAATLARHLGLNAIARSDLREIDVGQAVGMTKADLMHHYPELFAEGWHRVPFPGGESYDQAADRVARAAREIAAGHAGQRVAVVTHGGAIRGAIAGLVGITLPTLGGLFVRNTSITCISINQRGRASLLGLNDAAHLEAWATAPFA